MLIILHKEGEESLKMDLSEEMKLIKRGTKEIITEEELEKKLINSKNKNH